MSLDQPLSARGRGGGGDTNLEVLGDFAHEALEGELADEQLGRLLVATDLAQRDGARTEAMGFLSVVASWYQYRSARVVDLCDKP